MLKPFKTISKLSQASSYPTLWLVSSWVDTLKTQIQTIDSDLPSSSIVKVVTSNLLSNLKHYFKDVKDPAGIYLKSSFMAVKLTDITKKKKLMKSLVKEFQQICPSPYETRVLKGILDTFKTNKSFISVH